MNKVFLHVEGLFVLALSVYLYAILDFSWMMFFLLLFVPDISMFGYVVNKRIGAISYNLFHTYSVAIGIIIIALLLQFSLLLAVGLILAAHIGMDRMLGYGLKYPTNFKDTHLQRV